MSSRYSSAKAAGFLALGMIIILLLRSCNKVTVQFFTISEKLPTSDEFRFASYYQDNMVLQAEPYNAVIWGFGIVGSTVEVTVNGKSYIAQVTEHIDGQGEWFIILDPQPAGTPAYVNAVHITKNQKREIISINNVVFGDVWMCSGQSNMAFPINHMYNFTDELDIVSKYPDIRIFTASEVTSETPLIDLQGITQNWAVPAAGNVESFSAVCWLFGRHLQDKLKRPIGLVQSDWGGTPVESWSSPRSLKACGIGKTQSGYWANLLYGNDDGTPHDNSVLWNAMIHPFLNMTIKGAIWYQGEANAAMNRDLYNCTFPNMIKDWRLSWAEGTRSHTKTVFPFGFVQLSTITSSPENGRFPVIRWHQTADYGYVPNPLMPETFMAVALDLPDPNSPYRSVHPRDKQDVGLRLSSAAFNHIYKVGPNEEGPYPLAAAQEIDTVVILYSSTNLVIKDGVKSNFEICCLGSSCDISDLSEEGMAEWLPSYITDEGTDTIQIMGTECKSKSGVKKVRYAWSSTPCEFKGCQIYSKEGFPAPPFVIDVVENDVPNQSPQGRMESRPSL